MRARKLFDDLQQAGARFERQGERLIVHARAGVVTTPLQAEIQRNKTQLLALLEDEMPLASPDGPQNAPGANEQAELPAPAPIPAPEASWDGERIKIEDLPAFKERMGLVVVGSEWREGAPCPIVYFRSRR